MVKIEISNRAMYSVLAFFIVVLLAIGVYAVAPNPGHGSAQLDLSNVQQNVLFTGKVNINSAGTQAFNVGGTMQTDGINVLTAGVVGGDMPIKDSKWSVYGDLAVEGAVQLISLGECNVQINHLCDADHDGEIYHAPKGIQAGGVCYNPGLYYCTSSSGGAPYRWAVINFTYFP